MASLPSTQVESKDPVRNAITAMAPEFKAALPAHVTPEKFTRVVMTAVNSNPDLRQADRASLFGSVVKLAQDGLLPDGREAALVIFNTKDRATNGWVKKVQAMPMVSGLLKMMRQSGEVAWVDAQIVHANDSFQYRPGLDDMPIFEPNWFGERGEIIGAYAIARLKSGEIVPPEIMNRDQIEKVRNVSRSKDRGPWVDWFDQMALKTVLRRYLKRLPTSTDLMDMLDRDETMAPEPMRVIEGNAEPIAPASRLDALESQIEDAEAEPVEEGKPDEERGEGFTDETPAWQAEVDKLRAAITGATDQKSWKKAEADYLRISAGLPDDVAAELDDALTTKRNELGAPS